MTTKTEMVAIIKAEKPSLRVGDEDQGYTDLTPAEYEAQVSEWADSRLLKEAQAAKVQANVKAREALLIKMGITAAEAELLLG
jgi:hypothetical protein